MNVEVKLVLLREEHLEKVRKWRMSEEVTQYMYTDPIITPEQQKQWFNKIKNDSSCIYWVVNVDGVDVGVVNLVDIDYSNLRCFWAYYLADPSIRGKGVGKTIELNILKFVFDTLKLNKLCCEVLSFNEIVVKIHEKYGSKVEGIFREHIYKNGEFYDVVRMGILAREWREEILPNFEIPPCEIEYKVKYDV